MEDATFFNEFLTLTLKISALTLPFSFTLLFSYEAMGVFGIFVGALPFVTVSFGTKYFFQSKSRNSILTDLNKYSRKLNKNKSVNGVITTFITYLLKIIPSKNILLFETTEEENQVVLNKVFNNDQTIEEHNQKIKLSEDSIVLTALNTQKIQTFSRAKEWEVLFSKDVEFHTESGVVLPVHILNQNIGFIVISHVHQSVYDEFLLSLIELFYKYFLIVLDNANNFERLETSNITDYLTKLPNLRGFRDKMKEVKMSKEYDAISVIVMDLDYFKQINDDHGHEAGNEVLKQVADILKEFVDENIYVARYGGEEFVLLLKNYGKESAYDKAEQIRSKIETYLFIPRHSISVDKNPKISITASLGVATYPDDCDDLYELITLADRVMFLESKKSGRNRVAEFLRES